MPVYVDARPPGIDLEFRPATTLTVVLNWPAGELDGRTFTSTLGSEDLTVTVVGDVMTVEADTTQTALTVDVPVEWLLLEDLGGPTPEPVMAGNWSPSEQPARRPATTVVLTDDTVTVDVAVYSGGLTTAALNTHAETELDDGLHGVTERVWGVHGTTGLTRRVMEQDASNSYAADVSSGYLRFTASSTGAQQREAWELPSTTSLNSELSSVIGPANTLDGGVAQWGHLHGIRFDSDANLWRGWAVWTDTTIPVPTLLNYGYITFAGGDMSINNAGNNPILDAISVLRYVGVTVASRSGGVVSCWANSGHLPPVGSTGALSGMGAVNATGATVTESDQNLRRFRFNLAGGDTTVSTPGEWHPDTRWATTPFRLKTQLVSQTLRSKLWRLEEEEPDWSDPVRVYSYTITTGSPAPQTGEGACGLWVAHMETPNALRFGDVHWRKLPD